MHFVSKGGTDGTDGGIEKWDDAFTCYGPGPDGIEHEGIRFGFGNMDKVVICSKCNQAWGWRERLWRETAGLGKDPELQTWIFQQHQEIHRFLT